MSIEAFQDKIEPVSSASSSLQTQLITWQMAFYCTSSRLPWLQKCHEYHDLLLLFTQIFLCHCCDYDGSFWPKGDLLPVFAVPCIDVVRKDESSRQIRAIQLMQSPFEPLERAGREAEL